MLPPGWPPSWSFTGSISRHSYAGPPAAWIAAISLASVWSAATTPSSVAPSLSWTSSTATRSGAARLLTTIAGEPANFDSRVGRREVLDVERRDRELVGVAARVVSRGRSPAWTTSGSRSTVRASRSRRSRSRATPIDRPGSWSPTFIAGVGASTSSTIDALGVEVVRAARRRRRAGVRIGAPHRRDDDRSRRTSSSGRRPTASSSSTRMPSIDSQKSSPSLARVERAGLVSTSPVASFSITWVGGVRPPVPTTTGAGSATPCASRGDRRRVDLGGRSGWSRSCRRAGTR